MELPYSCTDRNGKTVNTDKDKAKLLNEQFTGVHTRTSFSPVLYMKCVSNGINKTTLNPKMIKFLYNLNVSKDTGPDSLHHRV